MTHHEQIFQQIERFHRDPGGVENSPSFYLTGPTASGKTALGIALAEKLDAEIISMDSMSVYRSMDIGTAKPTLEEQAKVPHHLIDIVEPEDEFSIAQYVTRAQEIVQEIRARGKRALFVGGTPLYLKGLLRGLFDGPPANADIRKKLTQLADSGIDLHQKLTEVDAATAKRLHPNDLRRIVRALEVYELTGQPISVFQTQFDVPASKLEHIVWTLNWDTEELNARIDRRVVQMFEDGFLEEARQLSRRSLGKTASQAVGYREIFEFFKENRQNIDELIALIQVHTHQFAKRQRTWFRGLPECQLIRCSNSSRARSEAQ